MSDLTNIPLHPELAEAVLKMLQEEEITPAKLVEAAVKMLEGGC